MSIRESDIERIAEYTIDNGPDNCTGWRGALRKKDPRPRINLRGKVEYCSRILWTYIFGPIPEGVLVCHKCDNPVCLNLKHLYLGTKADNAKDAEDRGLLQRFNYNEMDELLTAGWSPAGAARKLGVTRQAIHYHLNKRT